MQEFSMRSAARAALAGVCVSLFFSAPARAEEGMWTFDRFPIARMQSELGWAPDQAWLDRVMAGLVRIPGCSASNVSANGLVLTNHHCVIACLAALSSTQANYVADGFMARERSEERRCPNMSASVLQGIEDVTARIDAAAADAPPELFARARDAEISRIEGACTRGPARCEVVTLHQGGRYSLYRYRRYDDVRLVFAPERDMAAFGGDSDNFNFPRYCIDFAFFRLYENGAPARTPSHLAMRFTPLEEGEIVLSAGSPGATSRLRTTAELSFERDVNLPWRLAMLDEQRERLIAFSQLGPNQARTAASALQSVENSFKALSGRRQALSHPSGFARVSARETDLQARVRRNRASAREVGDAWGEIERATATYRGFYLHHQLLEARAGEGSDLFLWARDLVRGAAEREKPDAERMPRYTEARIASVVNGLRAPRPVEPALEELDLTFWLSRLREYLAVDNALTRRLLGDESPETVAARLSRSRLVDPAYRMQLWEGGAVAVAASDDPMIVFVRSWDEQARTVRQRFVAEVEGPVARAQERIAQARFRAFGETQYPDATSSPRVSYGRVAGWTENGATVPAFTRLAGLYDRATGAEPFRLSQRWIDARPRLDPSMIFNVSSTNDSIAGNSGSPLLDREGRVVGALFDGNIHLLGGEYFYDGALNRAVTVSAQIMLASLREVYAMPGLADELEGR
jgi:hypothetical protein